MAAALKPYRTVVVNCSACVYTLRAQYPAEGVMLASEVLSLAEFLARLEKRRGEGSGDACALRTVYYHDPCYLARYTGVTEEPRQVLSRLFEVRELPGSRSETDCCGGAGCDKSPHRAAGPWSPRARPAQHVVRGDRRRAAAVGVRLLPVHHSPPALGH